MACLELDSGPTAPSFGYQLCVPLHESCQVEEVVKSHIFDSNLH